MPSRRKPSQQGIVDKPLELPEQVLAQLIDRPVSQADLESILRQLKKAVI